MLSVVCGGAGFVGVNLVRRLLERGKVVCIDDLSLGSLDNMREFQDDTNFVFIKHDLTNTAQTIQIFQDLDKLGDALEVWHLAANSDILAGVDDPDVDIKRTFITTVNILSAMRIVGAKKIYFASSSAIYGDMGGLPASEDSGPLLPISNYGAMKLASEGLISAAKEAFLDVALLYRFPNVVGVPATHGVILDLVRKLKSDDKVLPVLGDGSQRKSYLHVSDLVSAMLAIKDKTKTGLDVYNIGPIDEGVFVSQIAQEVVNIVSPEAQIQYGNQSKGWVGDVPVFQYSLDKLIEFGWTPSLSSKEAVSRAVAEISAQELVRKI